MHLGKYPRKIPVSLYIYRWYDMLVMKHHWHLSEYIIDSKVHGANMGPIWGRQDPGGPYVGLMNFVNWDVAFPDWNAVYLHLNALCT